MSEALILDLVRQDSRHLQILCAARSLNLPDWCLSAGFIRNMVWDYLYGTHSPKTDIDVIYFDPSNINESREKEYESDLLSHLNEPWSVKNQARMAVSNEQTYTSTEDALAHYPETATAIGVRLNEDDSITLITPYGIKDLISGIVRATPKFSLGHVGVLERCQKKGWLTTWPKLKIVR